MRASIVIATRNRAGQLLEGLASIRAQNYQDIEVIVVDDASTDHTQEVLDHFPEFKQVRLERTGGYRSNPSYVLNAAHRLAQSEIIIEQGGEVVHLTDCVTPLLEVCRPGMVAMARVHNGTIDELRNLRKALLEKRYPFPANYTPDHCITNADRLPVPRVLPENTQLYVGWERPVPFFFLGAIHRRDFNEIGGYDESITTNNDGDLAKRLWDEQIRFVHVGSAIAFHLKHGKT